MERREFLRFCCSALGAPFVIPLLHGCSSLYEVEADQRKGMLEVPRSAFLEDDAEGNYRDRVLIRSDRSDHPVILRRTGTEEYEALLLQCTHQRCTLNVGGGVYSCPCHGSSFSKDGRVIEGPATRPLQTLKTETKHDRILVHLP